MDRCPPEVLHQIFGKLQFEDVATLRLMGSKYAAVGVEYLATRIRFHTAEESLLRLKVRTPLFRPPYDQVLRLQNPKCVLCLAAETLVPYTTCFSVFVVLG